METSQWIACGVIPAVIAAVACAIAGRLTPRPVEDHSQADSLGFAPLCLGLGWTIAVIAGLIGYRYTGGDESSFWWPDDFGSVVTGE